LLGGEPVADAAPDPVDAVAEHPADLGEHFFELEKQSRFIGF
jgi:hypothetical protein